MNKVFDYKDINLVPDYSDIKSRSECDTSVKIGNMNFKIPHIPANMESVINTKICIDLAKNGYFYILHRFLTKEEIKSFIIGMKKNNLPTSISIGVKKEWYGFIDDLIENNLIPDYITIDIAHGHSIMMKQMLNYLKNKNVNTFIIAGNVSTVRGANFLLENGADSIKIGIGPGNACTTAHNSGFGSRKIQASILKEIADSAWCPGKPKPFIIADGGVKYPSDVAKALTLGADAVMCGSLFSGTSDSPGGIIEKGSEKFIRYWGSASEHQSGKSDRIEGTEKLIPYKGKSFLEQCKFLEQCMQSSLSYNGSKNITNFKKTAKYLFNN